MDIVTIWRHRVTFQALRSAGGKRIRDLGAIEAFVSQTNAPTMGA
jgi:hypothetical protein